MVQADYTGGTAHWCGAAQKGSTSGRAALELLTGAGYGKVPAFSILIHIHDMADRKIYRHAGGVEILQKSAPSGGYRCRPSGCSKAGSETAGRSRQPRLLS